MSTEEKITTDLVMPVVSFEITRPAHLRVLNRRIWTG